MCNNINGPWYKCLPLFVLLGLDCALSGISGVDPVTGTPHPAVHGASLSLCNSAQLEEERALLPGPLNMLNTDANVSAGPRISPLCFCSWMLAFFQASKCVILDKCCPWNFDASLFLLSCHLPSLCYCLIKAKMSMKYFKKMYILKVESCIQNVPEWNNWS